MKSKPRLRILALAGALVGNVAAAGSWETSSYTGLGFIDWYGVDFNGSSTSTYIVGFNTGYQF